MKIALCGSMLFSKEMMEIKTKLESFKHVVVLPKDIEKYISGEKETEGRWEKQAGDLFRNYWNEINKSDAVLIVNISKNNIENYIGGSTLIEMGFAHILNKKIYLLNSVPEMNYKAEIGAMNPIILNGDLSIIHE
ncbi:MAG: hypothetical protein PHV47_02000 [Candidatus Pacebacteria bacterium]|nr:hypothetical protein [Candidatus Paceibacterota bacterium]